MGIVGHISSRFTLYADDIKSAIAKEEAGESIKNVDDLLCSSGVHFYCNVEKKIEWLKFVKVSHNLRSTSGSDLYFNEKSFT